MYLAVSVCIWKPFATTREPKFHIYFRTTFCHLIFFLVLFYYPHPIDSKSPLIWLDKMGRFNVNIFIFITGTIEMNDMKKSNQPQQ